MQTSIDLYVLTLVLSPLAVTGCLVVDAGKEMEFVQWDLLCLDSQLLVEFPLCCALDSHNGSFQGGASLAGDAERVRATGVGPHVLLFDKQLSWAQSGIYGLTWESNLLGCALLQEQAVLAVKKENGECAVEQSLVDVLHQVAWRMLLGMCARVAIVGVVSLRTDFLARASDWLVIFIQDDADFVHEADLLFIVAFEVVVLGSRCCCGGGQMSVYLGKQAQNVVSSNCLRLGGGGGGSCAHGCDCGNGANDCEQMQAIREAAIGRVGGDWALHRPWSDCGPSDAGASFSRNQNSTLA